MDTQEVSQLNGGDTPFVPGLSQIIEIAKKEDQERKQEDARIVSDFKNFSLTSWGYTRPLKITHGATVEYIRLKIKSLGLSDVMEAIELERPMPPSIRKGYKKDTETARQFTNGKHDVVVYEIDEADPVYIAALRRYNMRVAQMWVVYGLAIDLELDGEPVIRGADITRPNEVIDMNKALAAIRRTGISQTHYASIMEDIRLLTADVEEAEQQE